MTVRDYIIIKRGGFLFLCSHATVIVHPRSSNEKNVRLLSSNRNLRFVISASIMFLAFHAFVSRNSLW